MGVHMAMESGCCATVHVEQGMYDVSHMLPCPVMGVTFLITAVLDDVVQSWHACCSLFKHATVTCSIVF